MHSILTKSIYPRWLSGYFFTLFDLFYLFWFCFVLRRKIYNFFCDASRSCCHVLSTIHWLIFNTDRKRRVGSHNCIQTRANLENSKVCVTWATGEDLNDYFQNLLNSLEGLHKAAVFYFFFLNKSQVNVTWCYYCVYITLSKTATRPIKARVVWAK